MNIPTDGRTLTLYRNTSHAYPAWYVVWHDDAGKQRRTYVGATLPRRLQRALNEVHVAQAVLQAAIKIEMSERQRNVAEKAEVQG